MYNIAKRRRQPASDNQQVKKIATKNKNNAKIIQSFSPKKKTEDEKRMINLCITQKNKENIKK